MSFGNNELVETTENVLGILGLESTDENWSKVQDWICNNVQIWDLKNFKQIAKEYGVANA